MANWKELGEIPDSEDDEAFDSQPLDSQPILTTTDAVPVCDPDPDIWDFPESPNNNNNDNVTIHSQTPGFLTPDEEQALDLVASSPLSSALSEDGLSRVEDFFFGDDIQHHAGAPEHGDANRLNDSQTESHSPSAVAPGLLLSPDSPLNRHSFSRETDGQSQTVGTGGTSEAQRVAIRYERSLRPRKPIQEHPYLLENAQYSSFLKLHGVKPLRMAIENERRKRDAQSGVLQEDDFQEDSQESCEPDTLVDSSMDEIGLPGDLDALVLPSSTPLRQSPTSGRVGVSSPVSSLGDTDDTSVLDQDLPAIEDLLTKPPRLSSTKANKRDTTPLTSSIRKRMRRNIIESDPVDEDSAQVVSESKFPSTQLSPPLHASSPLQQTGLDGIPNFQVYDRSPTLSAASIFGSILGANNRATYIVSSEDSDDGTASENGKPTSPDSEDSATENETVTTMSRRIRGVLPASWLRLDRQAGRENVKSSLSCRTRLPRSPERDHRRGVAQSRHATHGRASLPVFYDASDEEEAPGALNIDENKGDNRNPFEIDRPEPRIRELDTNPEDDGDSSVVEDNGVDFMLSRAPRKRQLKLTDTLDQGVKKRPKRKDQATKQSHGKLRQVGIKAHLHESRTRGRPGFPLFEHSQRQNSRKQKSLPFSRKPTGKKARTSPPKLSILDIIQPDAPQFLKIAARTARTRRLQGRSSPHKKMIQLATRQDQLDVASVLIGWRSGSIKQRDSVTAATKSTQRKRDRTVLAEASGNRDCNNITKAQSRPGESRKLVKHVSNGGSIRFLPQVHPQRQHTKTVRKIIGVKKTLFPSSIRPAQLETDEIVQMSNFEFNTRKRFLDRLYQNGHSGVRKPSSESSSVPGSARRPAISVQDLAKQQADKAKKILGGPRHRKKAAPRRIDIDAPQYSHAQDPVPATYSAEPSLAGTEPAQAKLVGLGPYGTQYTHHFEIFPLHPDTFFHESTLIGSGELQSCTTAAFSMHGSEAQPCVSISLNDHLFRWGAWNDQTSSELGVVLDYIADGIETQLAGKPAPAPNETLVLAASFVLGYVKGSFGFFEQSQRLSSISRVRECLDNLNNRTDSIVRTARFSIQSIGQVLQTYDRLILIAFLLVRFCNQDRLLMTEKVSVEISLQSLGATAIGILTELGIGSLQRFYAELHTKRFGEGGIRNDYPVIHSWVMVMKVMDLAQIPRASFWDVAQRRIAPRQDLSSCDAQVHERIWENVFTLLPLVEFSNTGIVVAGQRHNMPSDGWTIPQKLLRQVFQLYERNPRQAASFNNYCRALVGRCHYLVQEWGWRRCVSIIGLIFDFFGSQQLAHLRNEEVFKSPRFLEDLGGRPNLAIEPEDRCFHVFLKLVAVAIRKLRAAGSVKDIGNLVTRIVPNHNRQHRKDENVHARDLAALRNHHDLLCTLFWAAPAECRPSPVLIQSLVDPADSHKEACVINLRAWTQLARLVVGSGEARVSWRLFHTWRSLFFEQVLKQYNSVASEVALQLSALGKEVSHSITDEMINTTISANKAALIDVVYESLTASLDVIRHAPDLPTATYPWNITQLRTIFTQFSVNPPELAWELLRVSLATLETMLSKIDDFKSNEESQQSESQIPNAAVADDALLVLDQDLSKTFFGMARRVLATPPNEQDSHIVKQAQVECTEQIVILAARMSMRFINGGLMRLSGAFKGSYRLFSESPFKLDLRQWRYMVLFISTLLRYGIDDFDDAGFSLCDIWVSSLTKPRTCLKYEIEFGKELHRHGKLFVPEAVVDISIQPDYSTNRDLLEYAISSMRKAVRDAGPTLRAAMTTEYSSALKLMMDQIKDDLKNGMQTPNEQESYVIFIQGVISLVKTHASDICAVDNYFCQISKEYSPPADDPQLKVASLKSYGLRLQDGDARIGQSLFHLLFNNAKFSIFNDKLTEEVHMLGKGMSNTGVKTFIMSKMLPSIIYASCKENDAFPLLDIYVEAFALCFRGKTISLELSADDVPAICTLLQAILNGINGLFEGGQSLTGSQMHLASQVIGLGNLLWPSIHVLSMSKLQLPLWTRLWSLLCDSWVVVSKCHDCLQRSNGEDLRSEMAQSESLPMGTRETPRHEANELGSDVANFAENIVQDVRKNWKVTEDKIAIHMPGQKKGAAIAPFVAYAGWKTGSLVNELNDGIQEWSWWWRKANGQSCLEHSGSIVF